MSEFAKILCDCRIVNRFHFDTLAGVVMEVNDNTLSFKSRPEFYGKEKSGIKNNTVRYLSNDEAMKVQKVKKSFPHVFIKINNTETSESFYRVIQDISTNDDVTVFTWNPQEIPLKHLLFVAGKLGCKLNIEDPELLGTLLYMGVIETEKGNTPCPCTVPSDGKYHTFCPCPGWVQQAKTAELEDMCHCELFVKV